MYAYTCIHVVRRASELVIKLIEDITRARGEETANRKKKWGATPLAAVIVRWGSSSEMADGQFPHTVARRRFFNGFLFPPVIRF